MAGELTASTPTVCADPTAIKTAVDLLVLAATTDTIQIIYSGQGTWLVFKVERAA